ncbi:nuclear transport factor 2 family protein [Fulvivirga sp. 29W222]|uniref:Nuclear transport factor 2 family protein n=1 Tax=Fulvivirga marina TaxID=2494733 RepID=A0A937G0S7_9BACT|nr:nuclear transport factor 2 family protein [Fulvivirga marina]MBL6448537.1 nuclear transport factor 2 family protein [Fulvivirga marina]
MKTVREVANRLVDLCRKGQFDTAEHELYADNILSLEPDNTPGQRVEGIKGKLEKSKHFNEMTEEIHSMEISDPIIADNFFAISMKLDVTMKGVGRTTMEEICVYEVENGKIVTERFFFSPTPQAA